MPNTIDSALVTDHLSGAALTVMGTQLAALGAFTRDVGTNTLAPLQVVQVSKATAGATGQQNATDFESGNSNLDNIAVTVNQETVSFHISNAEANSGIKLAQLAKVNAQVLANQISDRVTPLMVGGNYSKKTAGAAANFDATDLADVLTLGKDFPQKNLILDGGHLAYLMPTGKQSFRLGEQGAYGFDLIAGNNRWTSGEANICGFFCGLDAIAIAAGLPAPLPAREYLGISTVTLPNGLAVQLAVWFSRKSRTYWASYDVMFGCAVGDADQGKILVTS